MFQRNLFDVAVSICQHHGLGQNGLSDVYKRWADFLYAKGEHMEAAQKYIQVTFGLFLNEFRGDSEFPSSFHEIGSSLFVRYLGSKLQISDSISQNEMKGLK